MDPRRRETFMGIPAVRGEKEQSYEEQRVADYLKAWRTTGKPPAPCPEHPIGTAERVALGLPPSFQPHTELALGGEGTHLTFGPALASSSSISPSLGGAAPVPPIQAGPAASAPPVVAQFTVLSRIPSIQMFTPTVIKGDSGESFQLQSIVYQQEFYHFCFEELRYHAYRIGKKTAPEAVTQSRQNSLAEEKSRQINGHTDVFQSISCIPAFTKHCFEELRIAYLRTGRELNSGEIVRQNSVLRLS